MEFIALNLSTCNTILLNILFFFFFSLLGSFDLLGENLNGDEAFIPQKCVKVDKTFLVFSKFISH